MSTKLRVRVEDRWFVVEVGDLRSNPVRALVDGDPVDVRIESPGDGDLPGRTTGALPEEASQDVAQAARSVSAARVMTSPMPGGVVSVAVRVGDQVVTGDEVCVLEAMKMQQILRADWTGIVAAVHVRPGQQVRDGDPILELG